MDRPPVVVIVVGAGTGRRLGGAAAKAFRTIAGRPILALAASSAASAGGVRSLVAAVPAGGEDEARSLLADVPVPAEVVTGGASRQASVRAALDAVGHGEGILLVHDAARPFATGALFERVIAAVAAGVDAVVPVVAVTDTVLRLHEGAVTAAEDRAGLVLAQTPQGFRADVLREAHAKAEAAGRAFTDDASLVRWAGFEVRTVEGEVGNVKITTAEDLADAERRAGAAGG